MVKLNIQRNKLNIIFSSFILFFMIILYIETLNLSEKIRTYPSLFIAITSIAAILKIITSITNSNFLNKLDNLTSSEAQEKSENKPRNKKENKTNIYRELFAIASYMSFFVLIYLLGFIIGVFIFVLGFNLLNSKFSRPKSFLVAIFLTIITYIAEEFLMTQTWNGIIVNIVL